MVRLCGNNRWGWKTRRRKKHNNVHDVMEPLVFTFSSSVAGPAEVFMAKISSTGAEMTMHVDIGSGMGVARDNAGRHLHRGRDNHGCGCGFWDKGARDDAGRHASSPSTPKNGNRCRIITLRLTSC